MSDAVGRKPPIIVGLILCLLGSVICLYSTNISALLIGHFLQGLGAGGSNVLARVILRDKINGPRLAQYISDYLEIHESAFGSVEHLSPVAEMSLTPGKWELPMSPLGTHEPSF